LLMRHQPQHSLLSQRREDALDVEVSVLKYSRTQNNRWDAALCNLNTGFERIHYRKLGTW
jgi:hypothetical protein